MIVLAALATAAAVWLAAPPPTAVARWRLTGHAGSDLRVSAAWSRVRARFGRRARVAAAEARVVEILELASAELRAGIEPTRAASHLAEEYPELSSWARALTDPSAATAEMAVVAKGPGSARLADLDAAWHLARRTGAPLAVVVDRVAAEVRDELELAREVRRQVAPARSTARIMAVLPVFGLVLGSGTGAGPGQLITSHPIAMASVALGVVLAGIGLWWIERIARSVEGP